jgi:uncharacterized repeat protein (TIGR01451 family)
MKHHRSMRVPLKARRRRATTLLAVSAIASLGLVATGGNALAVHDLKVELDGDTNVDGTSTYDWESFFQPNASTGDIESKTTAMPVNFVARGSKADYALPEFSTFATGSKDTLDIPKWQCGKSNNLGAKDDLVNVYVAAYRNPANNHLLLYFGAEKSSNLGDNNIAIWFLQDSSATCATTGKNTTWTGHHVNGDVLLAAAFTNGGDVADVEYHVWKDGMLLGSDDSTTAGHGFRCGSGGESADNAFACAITNDAATQPPAGAIDPPWNHPVKTPAPGTTDSLDDQEFYEGGIDVTQAVRNTIGQSAAEPCITTFVADTRSSQSPTATLFDYANGSFPVCHPTTNMQLTAPTKSASTVHIGESVTYTFYEKNDGDISLTNPHVTTNDASCSTATSKTSGGFNVGDTDQDGKLDPNETWQFTCTTSYSSAGTGSIEAIGHGTDPLSGNDVTFYRVSGASCTDGAVSSGRICDLQEVVTASVTVVSPGTTLREQVSALVTFTYLEKNTGDSRIQGSSVSISADCGTATATRQVDDPATASKDESLLNIGDLNDDNWLDVGETWVFTCQKTVSAPLTTSSASFTDNATGHGTDEFGGVVPATNESDSSSVTVTNNGDNTAP